MAGKLILKIQGELSNLGKIRSFVSDYAIKIGFDEIAASEIEMAVDELCTNIIKYSYSYDPDIPPGKRDLEIELEEVENGISISVSDRGKPFDPNRFPSVDIEEHLSEKKTHGLGIFTMKNYMDRITHEYREGQGNTVKLVKYLRQSD
jgi:anti-sigma regulatory factor (Ser/Thr protein kinase)